MPSFLNQNKNDTNTWVFLFDNTVEKMPWMRYGIWGI